MGECSRQRNTDPNIQASAELGIVVYLPAKDPGGLPLYVYARYYLARTVPVVIAGLLLLTVYPVLLKQLRRRRRRRWAQEHGVPGRIALAYCDVRDTMIDLGLPGRHTTPLEMYELVEADEEHHELAWLVTRGLWGDLRTELTEDDATQAEQLAASVRGRLVKAQPETARLLASVARASLREPYSHEVPNVWWTPRLRSRLRAALAPVRRAVRLPRGTLRRLRPGSATASLVLVLASLLAGCSGGSQQAAATAAPLPTRLAPATVGDLVVKPEPKAAAAYQQGARDANVLVSDGKVLSMSKDGLIQAALQVAQLKPEYTSEDPKVVQAIARSIGDVEKLSRVDAHDLYKVEDASQRIFLWFPKGGGSMALLVVRAQIPAGAAELLARSLIQYGDGQEIDHRAIKAAFDSVVVEEPSVATATPSPGATS